MTDLKIGRNDPCPCGSGKKYKNCCLDAERPSDAEIAMSSAEGKALDWLQARHRHAIETTVGRDFFGLLSEEEFELLDELDPEGRELVSGAWTNWLLGEGTLEIGGRNVRAAELVLAAGGPVFTAIEREWLEALAAAKLDIFEIAAVEDDGTVALRRALDEEAEPFPITDELGDLVEPGDLIAARPVSFLGQTLLSAAPIAIDEGDLDDLRTAAADSPSAVAEVVHGILFDTLFAEEDDQEDEADAPA